MRRGWLTRWLSQQQYASTEHKIVLLQSLLQLRWVWFHKEHLMQVVAHARYHATPESYRLVDRAQYRYNLWFVGQWWR